MKMSMGQMGRQLLGLAVAGAALVTGGAAYAERGAAGAVGIQAAGSRLRR